MNCFQIHHQFRLAQSPTGIYRCHLLYIAAKSYQFQTCQYYVQVRKVIKILAKHHVSISCAFFQLFPCLSFCLLSSCSAHSSNLSPTRFAYGQVTYKYTHTHAHTRTCTNTHTHTCTLNMWHSGTAGHRFGSTICAVDVMLDCFLPFSETDFPLWLCASKREREKEREKEEEEGQLERESPQLADGHVQCSHV